MVFEILIAQTITAFTTVKIEAEDYTKAREHATNVLLSQAGKMEAWVVDGEGWELTTPKPRVVRIVQEGKKIEVKNESIAGID